VRQRCEHALSTPRPFGSWEHLPCGGTLLTPLGFQGSLAASRPACMVALLTLLAPLQGSLARPACKAALLTLLTLFQGSLARPACMVALLTLRALLQGSLARPACRAALVTLLTL
jgi:hypothetical protein